MELLNFFEYDFLIRALIAGSLAAVLAGVLGVFLVLRKLSLIGDGLAHVSFGGVALGLLFGLYPFYISVPLTVVAAFFVFKLGSRSKLYGDAAIGIVSAVGVMLVSALLILPAAASLQNARNFKEALFGSGIFALFAVWIGLAAALVFSLPAGASIVLSGFFLFVGALTVSKLRG
ncbi:hypothetical protein CVU83_00110 [Candidatus Falkowbacteria bacterium HGW-Falkowbacteria-2]|uniref:ABC transporter n=1 Tax=Candidatus Falkowbacteria bacterium HGW-Falkowbacteria-2 TaxID=2013769 RepID=A0A2N2E3X4_9BACT|nr:MAG: hypothetical protein CVU83_00110 [Candidatus Falkowbacteria bacterium HGW-Falkowbacteria-2]